MLTQASEAQITLRPARAEDEDFLRQVYASTRADELSQVDWSEAQKQAFIDAQFAAQNSSYFNNYPSAEFLVVMVAGEPAGRLYIHRRPAEIRIMDLALLPPYRRRGIGSGLLRRVMAEGQARGSSVTIHVEKFNPALRLYQRLGFHVAEDKGVYYLLEWGSGQRRMLDKLRCADFAPLVGETFRVELEGPEPIPLTLVSATNIGTPGTPGQRQPFSLIFLGPESEQFLRQGTYRLGHERMEELELFLVPIGPQAGRMQYEVIFA